MSTVTPWSVRARNTATASANKIHDDETARRYGFRGGLVPGVDVFAYLAHVPAAAWGTEWVEHGGMAARFVKPVYEDDAVDVAGRRAHDDDGERFELELRVGGDLRATARAWLTTTLSPRPDPSVIPIVEPAADPPPASPDSLRPGTVLALGPRGFHVEHARAYLDDIGETLPLDVAHPGWLLRHANWVLSENVVLGPWIHVESEVQHHSALRDGEALTARAVVTNEWERKGHRFVELDVLLLADDERAVSRTRHVAIYRPRVDAPPDGRGA